MLFDNYIAGFLMLEKYLPAARQVTLLWACRRVIAAEPLWRPKFSGPGFVQEFALQNTNCGQYGWLGDETGFRYRERNRFGKRWPTIPEEIHSVVSDLIDQGHVPGSFRPENCLINFYRDRKDEKGNIKKSHLGLHQDRTEPNRVAPIISISLGQACVFQIGGLDRKDAVREVTLRSGDVVVMSGGLAGARNAFHGVKCLIQGTTPVELGMKTEGRINLTIRQVY